MKLSEAIRKGDQLKPQVFGKLKDKSGTCAMGAAYNAVGVNSASEPSLALDSAIGWRWIHRIKETCVFCDLQGSVATVIMHMNDAHKWERNKIANWVANIEQKIADAEIKALESSIGSGVPDSLNNQLTTAK